jgi:hypothetical protein
MLRDDRAGSAQVDFSRETPLTETTWLVWQACRMAWRRPYLPLYRPKRELKDAQDGGRFNVVFFFRSTLIYRKVKARPRSRLIQRRALTPAMILFVALPEPKAKPDPG